MLAKFSGLNQKGPYLSLEIEKENFRVVLTYSIKRECEIRKFHVAIVQKRLRNVQKKRDARAKLFFFCCSQSPLQKLLIVVMRNFLLPW